MDWYNGYSPQEREAKGRARARHFDAAGPTGPCAMCGDDAAKRWAHSENYDQPYLWTEPAVYILCNRCHYRLHRRFTSPESWRAYWTFLRLGWYGREVDSKQIARVRDGGVELPWLTSRRDNLRARTDPWWEALTLDPDSLRAPWAKPKRSDEQRDAVSS